MPHVHLDDDTQLYYEDHGSGRPVVLIHGWPLSGRSWEPQVLALVEGGYRVITYDRRGFGSSSQPWTGYDYDTLAADLDALMHQLDLTDVVLVGFSMGGGEVARHIGRFGTDRIAGAVFASAVPPYLYKSDDNPDGGLDDATIRDFENGVTGDRAAFLEQFTTDFMSAGGDVKASDALLRYLRTIAEFASAKGTLDCISAFSRTDFRDDLTRVTVPTLVIHGDSDAVVPFEVSGRRTHEAVAGSRLVVIDGGPHGVNASHPEEFNRALLDFLGSLDDGTVRAVAADEMTDGTEPQDVDEPEGLTAVAATSAVEEVPAPVDASAIEPSSSQRVPADTSDGSQTADTPTEDPLPASDGEGRAAAASAAEPERPAAAQPEGDAEAAVAQEPVVAETQTDLAEPDIAAEPPVEAAAAQAADGRPRADSRTDPHDDGPSTASAPRSADGPDLGLTGLVWRGAGADDDDIPADRPGQVADPNLGDIPVDQQPRHGG